MNGSFGSLKELYDQYVTNGINTDPNFQIIKLAEYGNYKIDNQKAVSWTYRSDAGGSLDPDFRYRSKQRELSNDWRKEKPRTLDLINEYKELKDFEQTPLNKYVNIGTELLSTNFDVDASQVENTLKQNYGISDSLSREVVKNIAYNNKDVVSHTRLFDDSKKVLLRKIR